VHGLARLVPGRTALDVGGSRLEASDLVIATGSAPKLLPGIERTDRIITSDEALWYDRIPSSAVVIGAGAVGLEFASLYRSFGAEVTLVEALPRLAPLEDDEVSKEIARAYRKRGITTAAGASVQGVVDTGDAIEVTYDAGKGPVTVAADLCLVATGRGPVTEGLGLTEAGVSTHERGYVNVDARLRANVDHLWAIGDVVRGPMLAHKAVHEGHVAAEAIAGMKSHFDARVVPSVAYTDPEVAWVGLTEDEAKAKSAKIGVSKFPWAASGRAIGRSGCSGAALR